MKLATLAIFVVLSSACSGDPLGMHSSGELDGEPPIRTDALAYTLEYQPGIYSVRIHAVYTNRTSMTVYLHRLCGYGDEPHRYVVREDGNATGVWLGLNVCITHPLRQPIAVRPGASHADTLVLMSTESPNAQPSRTMAMRTGTFRLVYDVQSTNRIHGWQGVDLLLMERRVSNAFQVLPPE